MIRGARPSRSRTRLLAIGGLALGLGAVLATSAVLVATLISEADPGDEPVQVLLIGDSIMNQSGLFLEGALADRTGGIPIEVHNKGVNGSGLLTPQLYDWQAEAGRLVEEIQPDVVVVLFVGNYTATELYVNEAGLEVVGYTDQFFESWEREARELQQTIAVSGADIYWVNPPPMLKEEGEQRVVEFRMIHRRIAEDWTGTVLIDGTEALSTGEGGYAWELPDETGRLEQVRTIDSVHLTRHGAQLLAAEMARQIAPSAVVAHGEAAPRR